jgi:tRNA threonylcarbamoyladenosine biosynthesis protein TsaE
MKNISVKKRLVIKPNDFSAGFITNNFKETQKLGELLAEEILAGQRLSLEGAKRKSEAKPREALVLCMEGELGAGKTTFTQGLLKGLGVKGPYTSPTFVVMKEYEIEDTKHKTQITSKSQNTKHKIQKVYHIDAYRVGAEDILNLGWEEIIASDNNIVIVEWPERIKKILPKNSIQIKFEWLDENQRKISFN